MNPNGLKQTYRCSGPSTYRAMDPGWGTLLPAASCKTFTVFGAIHPVKAPSALAYL